MIFIFFILILLLLFATTSFKQSIVVVQNNHKKSPIKLEIDKYKDRIFCSKLPIVANALHTITKRGDSLQYADETVKNVLQSILELINVEVNKKFTIVTKKKIEKLIFEAKKYFDITANNWKLDNLIPNMLEANKVCKEISNTNS